MRLNERNLSYVVNILPYSRKLNLLEKIPLKLLIGEFFDLLHYCKSNYFSKRVIKFDQNRR